MRTPDSEQRLGRLLGPLEVRPGRLRPVPLEDDFVEPHARGSRSSAGPRVVGSQTRFIRSVIQNGSGFAAVAAGIDGGGCRCDRRRCRRRRRRGPRARGVRPSPRRPSSSRWAGRRGRPSSTARASAGGGAGFDGPATSFGAAREPRPARPFSRARAAAIRLPLRPGSPRRRRPRRSPARTAATIYLPMTDRSPGSLRGIDAAVIIPLLHDRHLVEGPDRGSAPRGSTRRRSGGCGPA